MGFLSPLLAAGLLLAALPVKRAASVETPYRRTPYVGAMSLDAKTGRVFFEANADAPAYPASVTKLMTAYLVLDEIAAGRLKRTDVVTASPTSTKEDAHFRQPSCTGLNPGGRMTVDELLKALLVNSANDAAIFLAERCAGDVPAFVARMNAKAAELGMSKTRYYNPNGLPPFRAGSREFNVSTCRDLAILARALLDRHPSVLAYTSLKTWNPTACGEPILDPKTRQPLNWVNHNNPMVKDRYKIVNPDGTEAIDGLKTGYINAGGSSIVATAHRGKHRVIVLVLGSSSAETRDTETVRILSDALTALSW